VLIRIGDVCDEVMWVSCIQKTARTFVASLKLPVKIMHITYRITGPRFRICYWYLLLSSLLLLVGCRRSDSSSGNIQNQNDLPEVVDVRKAFQSADPSLRNPVLQSLKIVEAGSVNPSAYAEAIPQLQTLEANPYVSVDQKKAMNALINRLKSEVQHVR
jgi:hypothetical protein